MSSGKLSIRINAAHHQKDPTENLTFTICAPSSIILFIEKALFPEEHSCWITTGQQAAQRKDGIGILDIKVYGNDIEKALRALKRRLQREGLFKEIRRRRFYEKPSEKRKRKQSEARKKRLKVTRLQQQR